MPVLQSVNMRTYSLQQKWQEQMKKAFVSGVNHVANNHQNSYVRHQEQVMLRTFARIFTAQSAACFTAQSVSYHALVHFCVCLHCRRCVILRVYAAVAWAADNRERAASCAQRLAAVQGSRLRSIIFE